MSMMGRGTLTATAELPPPNDGGASDSPTPQSLLGLADSENATSPPVRMIDSGKMCYRSRGRRRCRPLMYFMWLPPDAPGAEIRMDLPVGEGDHDPIEQRCVDGQDRSSGGARVQAEARPDVPAGQRAEVVVARLAVGGGTEQPAHPIDRALGLPRLTDVVVQPRHPEAGFVTGPQIGLVGPTLSLSVKRSSRSATVWRPPSAVTRPATFCGTHQRYCSALPSS